MDFSIFYAKFLGFYFVIVAISMIINPIGMRAFIVDALQNKSFVMLAGIMSLLFGLLIVLTHNIWIGWPIIITIIGYLSIIRGIIRLYFPDWFANRASSVTQGKSYYLASLIVFILGIVLLYLGYISA